MNGNILDHNSPIRIGPKSIAIHELFCIVIFQKISNVYRKKEHLHVMC